MHQVLASNELTLREQYILASLRKSISSYFPYWEIKQLADKGVLIIKDNQLFFPEEIKSL